MTIEEKYALLLSRSAEETALEMKKRSEANQDKQKERRDPCIFDFVQNNKYNINIIIDEFCRLSNSTREEMMGYSRKMPLANARHVLLCVLHEMAQMSNPQIARIFKRDASTVFHSCERGREIINENKFLMEHINDALIKASQN